MKTKSRLSERARRIKPSGIRRVFDIARSVENPINLGLGDPEFDIPGPVKEEGISAIRRGVNKYTPTQGLPGLRDRISAMLRDQGISFEDVLVTSGVTGGLTLCMMALIDPGDEVLLLDPYFVLYAHSVLQFGGVPVFVDTYPDFRLRRQALEDKLSERTKLLLINNPHNPTGTVYSREELEMVVQLARERSLLLVADEIYRDFTYDGAERISLGQLAEGVLVLNGFSKTWGMSGWRLGWASGPRDIVDAMTTMQQFSYVCAPSFAQAAGVKALDCDMSEQFRAYQHKRDLVYEALKDHFEVNRPQGAFYIFPKAPDGDAAAFLERAFQERVFCVPGSAFSQRATHFRISYAVPQSTLEKGLEILCRLARSG